MACETSRQSICSPSDWPLILRDSRLDVVDGRRYAARMDSKQGPPKISTVRSRGRLTCIIAAIICWLAPRAGSAQCRIGVEKARLKGVMVSASGVTFSLNLDGLPLTIELEPGKAMASLQVKAPLRFVASYPSDKLALRIKKRVDLYGGRVRLGTLAAHVWLGVQDDGMQLSLLSTLGIDLKVPPRIPCSNIELSNGTPYSTPQVVWPTKDRTIGMGSTFFPLYLGPQEVDPLAIHYPGPFRILRRRPGWVLIEAAWKDGSRVMGWTLERYTTTKVASVLGWAEGQSGVDECHATDGPILAKVTLRKEAPVAVSPGGPVWAWVARTLTVDALPPDRSDGWIQVLGVPGFIGERCSDYENIWVHARDVLRTHAPRPKSNDEVSGPAVDR